MDFKRAEDGFTNGRVILPDPGPLSYRGPGSTNFLYGRVSDERAANTAFADTAEYRAATTFVKVYPICGTDGYFSLKPSTNMSSYLAAIDIGNNNIVARAIVINSAVDIADAACWKELSSVGCPDAQIMIENKKYPGLVMMVGDDNKTVSIGTKNSKIKQNCWEKSPANTTLQGRPKAREREAADAEIRQGWDLSDDNRKWGPEEQRSYELQPQFTRDAMKCAEKAAENPIANGFVFIGNGDSFGNCRTKVGGYWNDYIHSQNIDTHRHLTSGKF